MASALYEAKRNENAVVSVWAVHISFPAFGDLSAKDFYWSTVENLELNSQIYTKNLKDVPRGRHQSDRGNDYAEITVTNIDHVLYQEILPYEDLIEKCSVTIYQCYEIDTDYYESEIKFVGYLKDFQFGDEDRSMKITCVSDMSRAGFPVGNRILTREKCGTAFNTDGTLSATESICGWQVAQGGNPDYCSKLLTGVDGCESHNNTHRFYAITGLNGATVTITTDPGDGGWNYGSGPCFTGSVFVVMADGSKKRIDEVRINNSQVMGFDLINNQMMPADVLNTERHLVDGYNRAALTGDTLLEVTPEHLFYLGDRKFKPIGYLETDEVLSIGDNDQICKHRLKSFVRVDQESWVYNLRTSTNNYLVTDEKGNFWFIVHNNKPPRDPGDLPLYV